MKPFCLFLLLTLTIVVSNRSTDSGRNFTIMTGRDNAIWLGHRYTPHEAGENTMEVPVGRQAGSVLNPQLAPQSWEFWVQQ